MKALLDAKSELVRCVKDLYLLGMTSPVSGNHSIRAGGSMWITPSETPRYLLRAVDLVRISLATGKAAGSKKPSIEHNMHRMIYGARSDVNAVVHTHSPYTIGVAISAGFVHVIEEAKIVVGDPVIIDNRSSGSMELAQAVSAEFAKGARAVVIKNHGAVAAGTSIHHARAIVESLEEWAKVLTVAKVFGGPRYLL
jgi:ribulose-5-phosphate 4-epimerase/fuculose-1-phosphate aldolase